MRDQTAQLSSQSTTDSIRAELETEEMLELETDIGSDTRIPPIQSYIFKHLPHGSPWGFGPLQGHADPRHRKVFFHQYGFPLNFPGFSSNSMDFHRIFQMSTGFQEFPPDFLNFHRVLWISTGLHGFPPGSKHFHQISIGFHWIPWISTKSYGFPRISMGFHCFPQDSIDSH